MYYSAPLLLSFAASALAYTVSEPSPAHPWTASGPQTLSWDRVPTDPSTFAVVLTDMSDSSYQQVLAAEVSGDLQAIHLNPPSGGWPQGGGFRLNLVQDVNHIDSVLAQSSEYSIGVSNTPSGSSLIQTATSPMLSSSSSIVRPTSSALFSSTFGSSTVLPVTATSSRSGAILPASSSVITTSASHVASPTSSATSSTTKSNAGYKALASHIGFVPFFAALNYLIV